MSTDDVIDRSWPCLCGLGSIDISQSTPDHPWASSSQASYSASLSCEACAEEMSIVHDYGKPRLVKNSDIEARRVADLAFREGEKEVTATVEFNNLKKAVVACVDSQPSVAAKHRLLIKLQISPGSIATYRKQSNSGASAVESFSASRAAHIGANTDLAGADKPYFQKALTKLEALRAAQYEAKTPSIKTGIDWLAS